MQENRKLKSDLELLTLRDQVEQAPAEEPAPETEPAQPEQPAEGGSGRNHNRQGR